MWNYRNIFSWTHGRWEATGAAVNRRCSVQTRGHFPPRSRIHCSPSNFLYSLLCSLHSACQRTTLTTCFCFELKILPFRSITISLTPALWLSMCSFWVRLIRTYQGVRERNYQDHFHVRCSTSVGWGVLDWWPLCRETRWEYRTDRPSRSPNSLVSHRRPEFRRCSCYKAVAAFLSALATSENSSMNSSSHCSRLSI